jgi:hypothetical protein
MANGTMTITVPNYAMLQQVAQRVMCWAGGVGDADRRRIKIVTVTPGPAAIQIPEEIFAANGALVLEPSGVDILADYVVGSHATYNAINGTVASQNPNTCAADPAQVPIISNLALNVGGNPLAITLNYANFAGAGTVNITWGDGTATNGAAEAGAAPHTYPYTGVFTIRVTDATVPTNFIETTIYLP